MYCIDVLLEEHDRITDFIAVARNACCSIIEGNDIPLEDLNKMLNFGKVYADNLHHKKEEDILFTDFRCCHIRLLLRRHQFL